MYLFSYKTNKHVQCVFAVTVNLFSFLILLELFVKDPIGNKLKSFHWLSLVGGYQHLIEWYENFDK